MNTLDRIIKKYRKIIIGGLYKEEGYRFDRIIRLYDEANDVILLVYVREKDEKSTRKNNN